MAIELSETAGAQPGNILLVPSRVQAEWRAARFFDDSPDGSVLTAPEIHTLSQWVAGRSSLIDLLQGKASPSTPDTLQIAGLWEAVIEASLPALPADERYAMASQARNANRLLRQWLIEPGDQPGGQDWQRYLLWRRQAGAAMRERNWSGAEDWMERLTAQLGRPDVPTGVLPREIRLAGFVELTALEERLLDALRRAGVKLVIDGVEPANAERRAGQAERQSFESIDGEISAAAAWAREQVSRGRRKVAVVVNGLDGLLPRLYRLFENVLEPDLVFGRQDAGAAAFCVSAGQPLAAEPMVHDALLFLGLSATGPERAHEFPKISRMLLSRNWSAGDAGHLACARLERLLRRRGYYRWSMVQVARLAEGADAADVSRALTSTIRNVTRRDASLPPVQQILTWLQAWGWPGGTHATRGETAGAARVKARFLRVLESLEGHELDNLESCLRRLRNACLLDTRPGPGGALSPVQVISPEEAFGLKFEAAWVMNLTMENWPPRTSGNPFLPGAVLERIPRATEDGILEYTERVTSSLEACADEVCFSWCNRLDDLPVSSSPLLGHLPERPRASPVIGALWRSVAPEAQDIDGYGEHPWLGECQYRRGPALPSPRSEQLRSAVSLLNFQSACPLAAYLVFRLNARAEPAPLPFPDPAWRGNLIHAALERFHSAQLQAGGARDSESVSAAVEAALDQSAAGRRLLPVEEKATRDSLQRLLEEWITFERRWDGGEIAALEWRQSFDFAGHEVDIRLDRVNRLPDGRLFLVDYKTGSQKSVMPWAEERIGDVQLPLYAVLLAASGDSQPAGLAVASVRPGEMALRGVSDDESCVTSEISGFVVRPRKLAKQLGDWDTALNNWRVKLVQLLQDYDSGDCRHQVFRPDALKYADLDILLRAEELARWRKEKEADEVR